MKYVIGSFFALVILLYLLVDLDSPERVAAREAAAAAQRMEIAKADSVTADILAGLRSKNDDFEEVSYYYANSIPYSNINRIYLYMPYSKGSLPGIRMKVQYAGDEYIYWNEAELKVDGVKMSLLGMGEIDREYMDNVATERTDNNLARGYDSENNFKVLRAVAKSKETVLRLSGDKQHTRTMTNKEKESIGELLAAYDAINEAYGQPSKY